MLIGPAWFAAADGLGGCRACLASSPCLPGGLSTCSCARAGPAAAQCAHLQEALKDAEAALKERATLLAKVRELQGRLDEEVAGRSALKDKAQRKLAAAEQEVRVHGVGGVHPTPAARLGMSNLVLGTRGGF